MNQPPAQTYSRIFRPWDGVGSKPTTPEPQNINEGLSTSELTAQSADFPSPQLNRINDRLFNPFLVDPRYQINHNHHQHFMALAAASDTVAQDALAYFAAQRLPYGSSGVPGSMPMMNTPMDAMMNAAIFNPIDQEYARILAEEAEAKNMNARKQRPKRFKCPHCDVAFSNNGQLKGHVRIHTGERPFQCDEVTCGKTFTRNEELTRHKRIHSGLRPYPCEICNKAFGRRDHLKKHTKTHITHEQQRYTNALFMPIYAPYLYGY